MESINSVLLIPLCKLPRKATLLFQRKPRPRDLIGLTSLDVAARHALPPIQTRRLYSALAPGGVMPSAPAMSRTTIPMASSAQTLRRSNAATCHGVAEASRGSRSWRL